MTPLDPPGSTGIYLQSSQNTAANSQTNPAKNLHTFPASADTIHVFQRDTIYRRAPARQIREESRMKATGIVRRIDDLGRVVIPKEIRRTMRIREGDPSLTMLEQWERFCGGMLGLERRMGWDT